MKRIADIATAAALLALVWMQVDTWKQARETNDFMRRVIDAVTSAQEGASDGRPNRSSGQNHPE